MKWHELPFIHVESSLLVCVFPVLSLPTIMRISGKESAFGLTREGIPEFRRSFPNDWWLITFERAASAHTGHISGISLPHMTKSQLISLQIRPRLFEYSYWESVLFVGKTGKSTIRWDTVESSKISRFFDRFDPVGFTRQVPIAGAPRSKVIFECVRDGTFRFISIGLRAYSDSVLTILDKTDIMKSTAFPKTPFIRRISCISGVFFSGNVILSVFRYFLV